MSDPQSDPQSDPPGRSAEAGARALPVTGTPDAPIAPIAPPSVWVGRWLRGVRPGGRVLDFACGSGRHARLAQAAGLTVLAVDRDAPALRALQTTGIAVRQEDLERGRWSFAAERFDAVICTNYLFRPRLDLMATLLAPGGLLIYETFAAGNARYGRPSNPDFLLAPGELARVATRAGLHLLAFEDGFDAAPRPARLQRIVAARPPFDPESLPLGERPPVGLR